jgi:hypothetical protein
LGTEKESKTTTIVASQSQKRSHLYYRINCRNSRDCLVRSHFDRCELRRTHQTKQNWGRNSKSLLFLLDKVPR